MKSLQKQTLCCTLIPHCKVLVRNPGIKLIGVIFIEIDNLIS